MGILNVTPDSFSDGGQFYRHGRLSVEAVLDHAVRLCGEGADLLDIGAESTRPGSRTVGADEEKKRLLPVIEAVRQTLEVPVSIDTYRAEVAKESLLAGADIINDIFAGTFDEKMIPLIAETGAGYCLMHFQGTPETMQNHPHYENVTAEVAEFLAARKNVCLENGVAPEQIVLDPGIGFGKNADHNLTLLKEAAALHSLGFPLLYGVSRKRFLDALTGRDDSQTPEKRLPGTAAACLWLASQGVQILRVHDVGEIRQALQVYQHCTK
jgi:dihydropteroate synthase